MCAHPTPLVTITARLSTTPDEPGWLKVEVWEGESHDPGDWYMETWTLGPDRDDLDAVFADLGDRLGHWWERTQLEQLPGLEDV